MSIRGRGGGEEGGSRAGTKGWRIGRRRGVIVDIAMGRGIMHVSTPSPVPVLPMLAVKLHASSDSSARVFDIDSHGGGEGRSPSCPTIATELRIISRYF